MFLTKEKETEQNKWLYGYRTKERKEKNVCKIY